MWRADAPSAENGVEVLGASVGNDQFEAADRRRTAASEQNLLNGLLALDNLQRAWLLLLYYPALQANYQPKTNTSSGLHLHKRLEYTLRNMTEGCWRPS